MGDRNLLDLSEAEIKDGLRRTAGAAPPNADDLRRELERRALDRHSLRVQWLAVASTIAAVVSAIAAVVAVCKGGPSG